MENVPVVAGLIMRMCYPVLSPFIGGPALYAATGMRLMGIKARIMTALSHDLIDEENAIINKLSCDRHCITILKEPLLKWYSENILGMKGNGRLDGMPSVWISEKNSVLLNDAVVVLSNGDPAWYQSLLIQTKPKFTLMDFNINWLAVREKELRECIRYVNIITITKHEYNYLRKDFFSAYLKNEKNFLIIKDGCQGSELVSREYQELLAPAKPQNVVTDVGCGDLLIGLLAGYLNHQLELTSTVTYDQVKAGYYAALPYISILLESTSNEIFIRRCVYEH